jgi:hypothetical protein
MMAVGAPATVGMGGGPSVDGEGGVDMVTVLRAELKLWEREFAARHGRKPEAADIDADIGARQRYKAYAKLKSRSKTPTAGGCLTFAPSSPLNLTTMLLKQRQRAQQQLVGF